MIQWIRGRCPPYLVYLEKFHIYLVGLILLFAGTGSRLSILLNLPVLSSIWVFLLNFTLTIGVVILWFEARQLLAFCLIIFGLIWHHAFAYLFQPSLLPGIPVQDWLFPGSISANYSFNQAMIYLKNVAWISIPCLAVKNSRKLPGNIQRNIPLIALGSALFVNCIVASVQGLVSLNWLASGSGSALDAQRASALLEDSGASTVYFSMCVSAVAGVVLFYRRSSTTTLLSLFLFFFALFSGAQTSGRIFFGATAFALSVLGLLAILKGFRHKETKRMLTIGAGLIGLLAVLIVLINWRMVHVDKVETFLGKMVERSGSFNDLLNALDPVRATHWRTMFKAFVENPIFGKGFGTFYSNYWQYLPWAKQFGGDVYVDPPASVYLLLISEFGLAGILSVILLLGFTWKASQFVVESEKPSLFECCAVGIFLSACFSFLVGTHILFLSVSSLYFSSLFLFPSFEYRRRYVWLVGAVVIVLCGAIIRAYATSPRPPQFNWQSRGMPQVPLTLPVPIEVPYSGKWFQSGTELLLAKSKNYFYVEMPQEFYPVRGLVSILDKSGRVVSIGRFRIDSHQMPKPGKMFSFESPAFLKQKCLENIRPSNFCSFRIDTDPIWNFQGYKVGFFLSEMSYKDTQSTGKN